MPAKTKTGSLDAKIKKRNARKNSRTAPARRTGRANLPAGVSGIARLTKLDFNVIDKGDYEGEQRFYCHGTCVKPKTFVDKQGNEHHIEGALVQPGMITLADTTSDFGDKSFEENVERAENRLKLLGFPTEDFDSIEEETLDYYKEMCVGEDAEGMYFKFSTWSPDDQPDRVNVNIEGPTEFEDDEEDDDMEESVPRSSKDKSTKKKDEEPDEEEQEEEQEEEESDDEEESESDDESEDSGESIDFMAVAEDADGGDDDAQELLFDEAAKLDIAADDEQFDNWTMVAEAIVEALGGEEEEGGDVEPSKGDIFDFKPPRLKTSQKCKVTHVVKSKKTVNLQSVKTKKIYKDIPWSKLS